MFSSQKRGQTEMVGVSKKTLALLLIITAFVGTASVAGIIHSNNAAYTKTESEFDQREQARTVAYARDADQMLNEIYRNIRTLSLLPDVRSMDRHATNLGENAKATIQQIYNNLWVSVKVSELYFVPESFDPNKLDSVTGKMEAPAISYDQMITDSVTTTPDVTTSANGIKEQPEIEDQEYALIVKQISTFRDKFPTRSSFTELNVPILAGPIVVTCDNSDFNRSLKEEDRSGLVFSVPVYRPDGSLAGVVAAIVRTKVMAQYLPSQDTVLVNPTYGDGVFSAVPGQALRSADFALKGQMDPKLIFSASIPLSLPDPSGKWYLWRGLSNTFVASQPELVSIRSQETVYVIAVLAGSVLLILGISVTAVLLINPGYRLVGALLALSAGDVSTPVPKVAKRGLLADIGNAADRFREMLKALHEAEAENKAQRTASEARRIADQQQAEAQAAARLIAATSGLAKGLKSLASGDLSIRLVEEFSPEFEPLRHDFNKSVEELAYTLQAVAESANIINDSATMISAGANSLSRRTENQAASLEESAASLDQLTATVRASLSRAEEAQQVSKNATSCAIESGAIVSNAADAMSRIEQSSKQISNIIVVIDEIAFQTNLLALNVGVEAARAGDAGRGFAVVAHEVRELAQRSAAAAKEIKVLINASGAQVSNGVDLVRDTGKALQDISKLILQMNAHMEAISSSSREQTTGLTAINSAINDLDQTTQQNAAMVEESSGAAGALEEECNKLTNLIAQFKLKEPAQRSLTSRRTRAA